ncbi:MFS transporter [Bradyrhizobium pachyrhizi]|uniref:MFS transporter n=1 Tax=Bradyrhizobium pachyrhizi TaxID=280333 RepID=A0A844SG72_9BRAD|nr:MFS transporter [Bradyrhizobium pachyrhizi]MVT64555.1 MFS transporter [Bradyrhizobium pachyrhizi]WFU59284.1 MFS transporter [Bradyrhizobium pachyrhizi]
MQQASSVSARLDRLPISKVHKRIVALVGGGMFFDNLDIYIAGAVLGVFLSTGFSSLDLNAYFVSATFLGMFLGTVGAGVVADLLGRRVTFQWNLAIFGLASLAGAAAPNMEWVVFLRFLCGVGLGAEIVLGYGTLAEFVPPQQRGRWVSTLSMISSMGLLVSTLLSWALIPVFGWRVMFAVPGVGALVILWLRKALPESPRWLEVKGRFSEADQVVSAIEHEARREHGELDAPEWRPAVAPGSIWQKAFIRPLVLGTVLQVIMFAALYGLVSWIPTFLLKQGIPINQTLGQSALMSLGAPTGAFVARLWVDRLGRRVAIIGGSIGAAVMTVLFGQATSQVAAVGIGFATFALIYFLLATIQAVYLPELFPTSVRMRCNAVCVGIARLTTAVVPFGVVYLFNNWGVAAVLSTIGGLLFVQAVTMALLGRETGGRSLELATNTMARPMSDYAPVEAPATKAVP